MTTAFVLGGGGAKGSFQIGVLKRLTEKGVIPDVLYGTSVGALNAAGFAYSGIDAIENVWKQIQGKNDIIRFQVGSLLFRTKGLYSTSPLRKLVESVVKGKPLPKAVPVVTVAHTETGEVKYITPKNARNHNMTFIDAVVASASMPFVMEPVKSVWVDGGVRETVPLRQAITDGATEIYVIMCSPWVRNPEIKTNIISWLEVMVRMVDLFTHEIYINDIQDCLDDNDKPEKKNIKIHLFAPDHVYVDTLDFSPDKISEGIKIGYYTEEIGETVLRSLV